MPIPKGSLGGINGCGKELLLGGGLIQAQVGLQGGPEGPGRHATKGQGSSPAAPFSKRAVLCLPEQQTHRSWAWHVQPLPRAARAGNRGADQHLYPQRSSSLCPTAGSTRPQMHTCAHTRARMHTRAHSHTHAHRPPQYHVQAETAVLAESQASRQQKKGRPVPLL